MISDDVRARLQKALERDVERYHQDTLIVRHQALCAAVAHVLKASDGEGESERALRMMR